MISMIVAMGQNREIGKNNELLWHIKDDLQNFRKVTLNKKIVMGANTYYSLPKKLDKRTYIVLSRKIKKIDDGIVFNDDKKLLKYLNELDEEVVVIGGASIYKLFLPYAQKLYITYILDTKSADAFFPSFSEKDFTKKKIKETNEYIMVEYERINNNER